MTKRLPVNVSYVNWRDGQNVHLDDIKADQTRNLSSNNAIVNNFFGSGILLESPTRNVIFDSDNLTIEQQLYTDFDGRGITPRNQPTDTTLGNQLEISVTDADVSFRKSIKICIIGTDFQNNIQYELFEFHANEIQVGKKHFKSIITLLFNDFKGNRNDSRTLGGRVLIKEAKSMQLSRDDLTASQNLEPNLFFRDFKVADPTISNNPTMVLYDTISAALNNSGYSVDALNINTGYVDKKLFGLNNITTRYGQKFKAKVGNIQKIRLLLGIDRNATFLDAYSYDWTGDLIISIHALQTTVSCPTDTIPNNQIDYQPYPTPLAQIIITQQSLAASGITLTEIAQPVEFSFSTTRIGGNSNTGITANNYYVITIQRAGDTTKGVLFTLTGRNFASDSIFTEFNGTNWTDDSTKDLWFEVYSDSLKISSGIGYDAGTGMSIDKTAIDPNTGSSYDYSNDSISMANNGQNIINYTIVQALNELIEPTQDDRTGEQVYSRVYTKAEPSSITTSQLTALQVTEDPIILGCSYDINNKIINTITKVQKYFGLASGNIFQIINPDSDLLSNNLVGSILNPDIANPSSNQYIIYKATLCTDGYGDLNGDGYIGADDVIRAYELLNENIFTLSTQNKIKNGYIDTLEILRADLNGDGYVGYDDINIINQLYKKNVTSPLPHGSSFQRLCLYVENLNGRSDGYYSSYDGYARLYKPNPITCQYNVDPLLLANSYTLPYFGYPVPIDIQKNDSGLYPDNLTIFTNVNYRITTRIIWQQELLKVNSTGRYIPCSFTNSESLSECYEPSLSKCTIYEKTNTCNNIKNDFYIPNNLIIGDGQILNSDGTNYPVDIEVGLLTLTLPEKQIDDVSIDIFTRYICESSSANGFTSSGYKAMKFADCSFVQSDALTKNQVRFGVSIQSLSQSVDGYSDGYYGAIVDPLIGIFINSQTGILTIKASNLTSATNTESCKILISVYLKKSGWKNNITQVSAQELENLF